MVSATTRLASPKWRARRSPEAAAPSIQVWISCALAVLAEALPEPGRALALALPSLRGNARDVLGAAMQLAWPAEVQVALSGLAETLAGARALLGTAPMPTVRIDLAEVRGFDYYTGLRIAGYARGAADAVLRGGRYDDLIAHADAAAAGLGLVRRPDAAPGGADGAGAAGRAILAQPVEQLVVRQDHVGALPDEQLVAGEQALGPALGDLALERGRVDDHALAEHAALAGVQDARRNEVGHQLLAVDDQRVAGVGPAAVADHRVGGLGVQVHDLALAFIAPLGADHDHDGHRRLLGSLLTAPPARRPRR